jgi:hypothetical protein
MPTMGLKTFSLSADAKSSFFAGESVILSVLIADAACMRVSIDAYMGKYSRKIQSVPAWKASIEEQTLYKINMMVLISIRYSNKSSVKNARLDVKLLMMGMLEE